MSQLYNSFPFSFQKLEAFVDVRNHAEFITKHGKTRKHSRTFRQYVSIHCGRLKLSQGIVYSFKVIFRKI